MDEQDINYINPRPDCHQHNHIHETNFSHNAPYIDLNTDVMMCVENSLNHLPVLTKFVPH